MASCKDCLHVDVCKNIYIFGDMPICEHFIDRNRFVELPCKIGDTLYVITERKKNGKWNKVIVERVVNGIEIGRSGFMTVRSGTTVTVFLSDLCKTVFLTREEAERALKERENNGKNGN